MIDIKCEIEKDEIKKIMVNFKKMPKNMKKIIVRTTNRTAKSIKTEMSKSVRSEYIIKNSDIKNSIKTIRANEQHLNAIVRSTGNKIPLYKFKVSPNEPITSGKRKKYKVKVKKSGKLKKLEHSFVADIKTRGLYERVGKKRIPTKTLYGPSIPEMLNNKKINEYVTELAQNMFSKRISHEIEYELGKMKW